MSDRIEELNRELKLLEIRRKDYNEIYVKRYAKQKNEKLKLSRELSNYITEINKPKDEIITSILMVNSELQRHILKQLSLDRLEVIYDNILKGKDIEYCSMYSDWYEGKLDYIRYCTEYNYEESKIIMKYIDYEDILSIAGYEDITLMELACKFIREKKELFS